MFFRSESLEQSLLPTVRVIVPCYNYGRYLRECVESVLNQSGVEVRALIIDDASTDDSSQVAAKLAAQDERVQVIRHEVNLGHVRTYNEGLSLADATYAVLLDADDMLTEGSLARACALMDAHPEVGLVYGRALVFTDDQPRPRPATGPAKETIWRGQEWFAVRCRLIENCIRAPEVVMRTSCLRIVGGFREELPHSGDLELWMRFALQADIGYISGPDQASYRDHAAGLHHTHFSDDLIEHQQMSAAFELVLRDYGEKILDRVRVESDVRAELSRRALRLASRAYDLEPFDPARAVALEAMASGAPRDVRTVLAKCSLRLRKTLGPRRWRTLRPILHMLTVLPRRWEHLRRRSLERSGLSP
jgi:glycosyltransferase involved in cell wall biosynthesis